MSCTDQYGPILFKKFIRDLILVIKDVNFTSYTNDNIIYQTSNIVNDAIHQLRNSEENFFGLFSDNQMKANAEKYHFTMSANDAPEIQVGESLTETHHSAKLLSVKIDYKLAFNNYVKNLCKKQTINSQPW